MNSNFEFLHDRWIILSDLGKLAEKNIYDDSNTTFIKLGMFAEHIVEFMFAYDNLEEPEDTSQSNRIRILKRNDLLPYEIDRILYTIRINRNKAAHEGYKSFNDAKICLTMAHKLGVWFMQTYGDWSFEPEDFIIPNKNKNTLELTQLKIENEKLVEEYELETKKLKNELEKLRTSHTDEIKKKRQKQSIRAASKINLDEAETRKIIDDKLKSSGWEVDTEKLRYSNGTRPEKNKNLAISEWPTKNGRADYALFVGLKFVGIIEAKRGSKDIPSDIEQSKEYARNIRDIDNEYVINKWGDYKVPFLFATNGRGYLKQLENKSGVWFLDARKSTNHPRALQSFYTPDGLMKLLEIDIKKANENLEEETYSYLKDKRGLGLRDYQINAIKSVEEAIKIGQKNILLSMATGTGKTRTVIGLIYRLIKSKRFKRILFLVDRLALGLQAEDSFKEAIFEDLLSFAQTYDIKGTQDKEPEISTKVHIATVQGMVRRILYVEEVDKPQIDDYDCIVVDEAHRGYILDKEMGDVELEFRNQNDYVSKYRMVLDYFDAHKIGLTATPALHTTTIFGKPVFEYSYREAVIDGYLVDHEPPERLTTELSSDGIKFKKGEVVPIYDPETNEIINSEELPDDLNIEIDQFNKKVITKNFNKVVLTEIVKDIDPYSEEKTLIFATTDNHADMIVALLKQIYEEMGLEIEDDAIVKITGSIKDPLGTIQKYKNELYPTIAVTVDLLTTGIDVPEICNLIFLRRVRSRILYEQMLGRATRLCEKINKTHFNLYDAVGVYEALKPVSKMKPVVASNKTKFKQLYDELLKLDSITKQKNHLDQIIAKLHRKKTKLDDNQLDNFKKITEGKTPDEFILDITNISPKQAIKQLKDKAELFELLDEHKYKPTQIIISNHEDKLLERKTGYGKAKKPEDYLEEFGDFIKENMNKIPALEIVCKRPKELTRGALKELRLELNNHGFTETNLNTAWKQTKNEDIAADIISFIRQQALGSSLISHDERIKMAINKVKKMNNWNGIQLKWIDRIEKQLLEEYVIDKNSFDKGAFKNHGGYKKIDKIFKGNLEEVIEEINDNLYSERGIS